MNTNTVYWLVGAAVIFSIILPLPALLTVIRVRRIQGRYISALPAQGLVETTGEVPLAVTTSPISKTPCVMWKISVDEEKEKVERNKSLFETKQTYWYFIGEKKGLSPFEMEDGTGKLLVKPINHSSLEIQWEEVISGETSSAIDSVLSGYGYHPESALALRATESVVRPNQTFFVLGDVHEEEGIKVIDGNGKNPLVISNMGEEGLLSTLYTRIALSFIGPFAIAFLIFLIMKFSK